MRVIAAPGRTNRAAVVEHAAYDDGLPVGYAGLRRCDTDDRMVRRYAVCGMPDGHQHHPASPDHVRRQRHRNAERRGDGGAVAWSTGEEGSSPWGRSGPTTPATVNRSRRELREERGRKALGWGAVRYQNGPRQAECQVRYGGDAMRRDRARIGWLGATTRGRMMMAHPQS